MKHRRYSIPVLLVSGILSLLGGYQLAGIFEEAPHAMHPPHQIPAAQPRAQPLPVTQPAPQPPAGREAKKSIVKTDMKAFTAIKACEADAYELKLLEGGELQIAPGLIKAVTRATFGALGGGQQDCLGLLDSFVQDRGLYIDIVESVLGGHPAPIGTNVLTMEFTCDENQGGALPTTLSAADEQAVQRTLAQWEKAAVDIVPCAYRADLAIDLPAECKALKPSAEEKEACVAKFHAAVGAYVAKVGAGPISHHEALACMFQNTFKKGNRFSLRSLQGYARRAHAVWLVRVKDRKVSWDGESGQQTWKSEMASWSILQLTVYVLEEALRRSPDLLRDAPPQYLLINALDNPKVGPWPDAAHPPNEETYLRAQHQADAVPSKEFVEGHTQWGSKDTNLDATEEVFPVLSWSTVPGFQKDIVTPNRHPGSCHSYFFDPRISATPWEEKQDAVLFRAFSTSCDRNSKGPRQGLSCFADDHNGKLTLGGTEIELDIGGGRGWGPTGSTKYLAPYRQAQRKYLLLLDGVVAAFRDVWLLQTGSVILAAGVWKTVRTQLLKPWVHYIPISSDLHDFEAALELVVRNQTYAKWVAANAMEASKIISGHATDGGLAFDVAYYDALLRKYAADVVVDDAEVAVAWTDDKKCGEWLETTGRVRQCIPDSAVCPAARLEGAGLGGQRKVNANYFNGNG